MELINQAYQWITTHGIEILAILGGLHAIAKITPTEADNKVIDFLFKLLRRIGLQPKQS